MDSEPPLNYEQLKLHVKYDPESGVMRRIGKRSGAKDSYDNGQGYLIMRLLCRNYRVHRLAFLYMTGSWPNHEVDHINGIRSDNRWCNLRDITGRENTHNQRMPHRNNSTGFLGVKRFGSKFGAVINVNRVRKHLGTFETPELAYEAYIAAKRKLHSSSTL